MAAKGRKILVAVDESEESTYALSWCLKNLVSDNQQNYKDTLILLFAKTHPLIYPVVDTTGYATSPSIIAIMEKYANELAEKVMADATQICKDFNDQITVETMVEHGDPRDVICDVAERFKVDFLVVGSHGYGIIKRAFLGSVSSHCAQNVKCPVLIVKKPNSDNADH
ncbi:hypothetical protein ABFS82_02G092600 [Erythranthe guttata]|uniref:UspA domain-containing protein n=1 Tax=Erythranthe guttata TaxID=4155 RepID=A0A022RBY7_ERYGU|nr:PREDICTED: universal stress protein A-like protein [Erythranthe guttata]EYU37243.1 hypothetical protein MIMGU_mgv1a023360mg [Erythranthe guttata]|eukprot:XP_012837683.1 PREDICTED: universal stress protein A-like protein [Erythranthe guttata]